MQLSSVDDDGFVLIKMFNGSSTLQNDMAAALQSCFKIINLTLLPRTVSNCCLYLLQGL